VRISPVALVLAAQCRLAAPAPEVITQESEEVTLDAVTTRTFAPGAGL